MHIFKHARGVKTAMDARDFEILVGILDDPTTSYQALGRRTGLSGTSVKNRLVRLREDGPLKGFVALPHAAVFGRESMIYWANPGRDARDAVEDVLGVAPVVWMSVLPTRKVAVHTYEVPGGVDISKLEDVLGASLERGGGLAPWQGDQAEVMLSSLDWRLVRHLIAEPRLSVRELVERTGLTRNTVSKRRGRLFGEGLVSLFPVLEQARSSGLVLYSVVVRVEEKGVRARAQEVLPNAVPVVHGVGDKGGLGTTFMGYARSVAEVSIAHEEVTALEEVREARLIMDVERRVAVERLEGWVEEEIARWERARGG